jgi:hypothetical protein
VANDRREAARQDGRCLMPMPHPLCKICKGQGKYTVKNDLGERKRLRCDCKEAWAETDEQLQKIGRDQQQIRAQLERMAFEKAAKSEPRALKKTSNVVVQKCMHPALHFEAGGLYVVCTGCGQAWQAVNKERLVPDFMARGWGFSELDVRKDPLS